MTPHGIVLMLPFVVIVYLVIRPPMQARAKSGGRNVDTAIPVAMAVIGCALLALKAVN